MATGASNCRPRRHPDRCAQGRADPDRRHAYICSLLGIRHVVLAVNKIDLVELRRRTCFDRIVADYRDFAEPLGFAIVVADPDVGALRRQRHRARSEQHALVRRARRCSSIWRPSTSTPTLGDKPFRFPVQWVNRPNLDFRGFAGTVAVGPVQPGDQVVVAASGQRRARSRASSPLDGDLREAVRRRRGDPDPGRRDRRRARRRAGRSPTARPEVADQFAAHLLWMTTRPMLPGRPYLHEDRHRDRAGHGHRAQAQGRRQHAASTWPPRRWR